MPTVLRLGRFRFYSFSNLDREPSPIHVKSGGDQAKFGLDPPSLAADYGFTAHELNKIARTIAEHPTEIREAWREAWSDYFSQA
jgi:hypothetical protein